MNFHTWLCALPQFLVLFPAAVLCYFPMKNQMKYTPAKTAALCTAFLLPYSLISALLCVLLQAGMNTLLPPALILFFILYRCTVKTDLARTLATYIGVCALQAFPAQFSYSFDARLNPGSGAAYFSVNAAFFQFGIACLLTAVLFYPAYHHFAWMIDQLDFPKVWYSTAALSLVFLILNALCIPHSYSTLYVGRMFFIFSVVEVGALALLLFLYLIFYHMAVVIMEHARLREQSQLLELQAEQYQALQNHMLQTSRLRHDFKHSIHILSGLTNEGDLESLKAYLKEYEQQPDIGTPVHYCANAALNALFNHYRDMAETAGIHICWQLTIPEPLTVSELDMASLFGNLMENAIAGCLKLPEGKRYFSLSSEVRHGSSLYIVSTNSFDGQTKKDRDSYLSTRHSGKGIGLLSISAVAEKYHGSVRISNSDQEFFVDVMIRV